MPDDQLNGRLKVLILEDISTDAELVENELRSAGIEFEARRVDSEESFLKAFEDFSPGIILSDYSLPSFDGESALMLAAGIAPNVPFIFVTGALGEDRAVDLLKSGATDLVLKDRLSRLALCVRRALKEAEEKKLRQRAEDELLRAHAGLERKVEERTKDLRLTMQALRLSEEELRKSHDELELRVQERTAELSASIARLEILNQELQEFAFVASHDLQEPLRKIQTFCDLAQMRCSSALDSVGRGYLDRVIDAASRMRHLLDDLLQFSRVAGRLERFKTVDLGKIIGEAADIFEEKIKEAGVSIETGDLPGIEADESQMLQLFQNLIGNALKYRSSQSLRIRISAKQDGRGYCEIFFEDNGIGFEQQYAERIFKPFQRLHSHTEYEGVGMGLAICRKIAERHGGIIRAESEPGKGSVFIIRLPVMQNKVKAARNSPPEMLER
ncbi:putative Histidine kinase [Syntrophobacter sp. SbD1]|nr:putative Histidine kinase [Syntrophobacter sp. SbD1]